MCNRGFSKQKLSLLFSEIKYSSRAKYLGANPGNICYFQGTRETQAESLLMDVSERIMTEAISGVPGDTTEVVSEDEGNMVTLEDIVVQEGVFSKDTAKENVRSQLHYHQKSPKTSLFFQLFSLHKNRREKDCAVCFQDRFWNIKKKLIKYLLKRLL